MRKIFKLLCAFLFLVGALWAGNASFFVTGLEDHETRLIAHRGIHQIYAGTDRSIDSCHASPVEKIEHAFIENTLPSIEEAFRLGADVVEIDVHLTSDNALPFSTIGHLNAEPTAMVSLTSRALRIFKPSMWLTALTTVPAPIHSGGRLSERCPLSQMCSTQILVVSFLSTSKVPARKTALSLPDGCQTADCLIRSTLFTEAHHRRRPRSSKPRDCVGFTELL